MNHKILNNTESTAMNEVAIFVVSVVTTGLYSVIGLVLMMLPDESATHISQIGISDKWLLTAAVALALFGGLASYSFKLQQKPGPWVWRDCLQTMVLSAFVALLVGLFLAGYISNEWWLGCVLGSAFFQNVLIAIIPQVLEQRIRSAFQTGPPSSPPKDDQSAN